ncbi:nucleotidyltransferase domain-containing protein [Siminovitchia farraginis]|uniref:nucleotidyltransferase domain-containing protein n=1 Tax=Heyndrickxia oleronia TaxID=38875 RepID=UPI00128F2949
MIMRLSPKGAALKFVNRYFPKCQAAVLAGSVVRGEETETSDLDVVIFDKNFSSSYRESFIEYGWAIEAFVHNLTSYQVFFHSDRDRAMPSLPKMVSEGIVIKDEGIIATIKNEANVLLAHGPEKWSEEIIRIKRYFLTDILEDYIGCLKREEGIFIANRLAELVSEFVLRTNQHWVGTSKWTVRALKNYDIHFAELFVDAFDTYYKTGDKNKVICLVNHILEPFGGQLFEGFSLGKEEASNQLK